MEIISIGPLRKLIKTIIEDPVLLTIHLKQVLSSLMADLQLKHPSEIIAVAVSVNQREMSRKSKQQQVANKVSATWLFNEHKVFSWKKTGIHDFTDYHFLMLRQIFITKSLEFLKYSSKLFIYQKHGPTETWSNEQSEQLLQSMKDHEVSVTIWKDVAYDLFVASGGRYFRTINQCREKWNNHLNPETKKDKWSLQEDLQLFQLVNLYGCKWSQIVKQSQINRTQHMVKNRYNFYYRKIKNNKTDFVKNIISQIKRRIKGRQNHNKSKQIKNEQLVSQELQSNKYLLKEQIQSEIQSLQNQIEIKLEEQIKQIEINHDPLVIKKEEELNPYIFRQNISTGHKIEVKQQEDTMKKNRDLFYYPFMEMRAFPQYFG